LNIFNKPVIRYGKNFENIVNLIKSFAPPQTIESKSKEQMEAIKLIDKTVQYAFNELKSRGFTEFSSNIMK
jgi:hypothetical protein